MGKRKERSLVELYKRTAKLSKPRITPILEGNCRIQGPVDESDSEFETDKQACSAGNRSLEESLAEHVENSNAGLKCNNQDEKSTVDLDDGTCDTVSMGKKITGKESDNEYSTGKPVSRDVVEREENSGSVKKRLNANIRRARGNKTRNIDLANTNSDCQQEVGRVKNVSMMEETGKVLECPRAFESNCKGKLPLAGHLSEEDSDKKCSDKLLKVKVTGSGDTLQNSDRDVQVCLDDKDRAESDRQIRSLKQNDGSNIDSRDSVVFDSVETPMGNKAVITSVVMASVADERNQEQNGPSDVPTVGLSMSSDSFKGSVLDMQLPVSEHCVGLSEIHANGNLCNAEDIKKSPVTECPSKLENTDKLTTTHAELLVETNIPIMGEANGLPCTVHAENVTTSGVPCRLHSEKVVTGETDTTAQVQLDSNQGRLLLPDNNIQPRISASSNIETADGYSNHSFLKESLCGTGEELMDLSGEYGPLDISASSSLQNREVMDRLAMEGNISQETVCSAPLSVTPCHSSVTSHASQSVTATKEIEAHSSCQQEEDLVFAGSTDPTEFSSTRKAVTSITEGDNAVIPVLPAVLPQSPADNKDECVKSNFSVGSLATSTIQHPCLEFRKDIDRVPVEVVPENQPEIGEQQVETVSKEWTPVQDPESKLDQDLHMGKASVKIEASETASHSGGSLPCQLSIEKSPSEPFPAEDDVKVCDICGDTGHEEMLAICSMCNDGAEHIYCMQTMLDEVPEGDWLCEGCKLKQNVNLKQVEAPQGLLMASKPACLNSRKQNFYGTARSRLSAKLDKRKLGPERKRAMKGIPSPQVSTKRQAEGLEVGPATKKLVVETNNAHQASLSSNEKLVFSRENSFKALDMGKIKTSLAGSSIGSPPSTILHDSGKSSISCSSPSPKVLAALPSSKSRFASLNGLTSDSLEVIGTSKATSNVSSAGLATLTVKTPLSRKSTDAGLSPRLPSRTSNVQKLSASPRAVKDSNEVGLQAAAARENASSSHAIVGFSKSLNTLTPLKCKANTTSFTVTKPRATSDVQKPNCLKTKEMRPGEVRKHSTELSRSKILSKSQSITRDSVSVGATNLPLSEKLATDDMCVKSSPHQVASSIKDSSNVKKISFGEDSTLAPAPLAQNATKKEHASMRVSGEAYAKLTASPSMLQESIMTNKLHRSDSTGALCTVPDGKSKGQSLFETSCAMSMPVENTFSPSVKEGKKGVCLDNNQLRESYPAEDVKKIDSLEKKLVAEGYPAEEGKKGANPKNAASITWSSSNHLPAVGSTRCYKCKELGHSAQSCTNRISVEVGSDSLRVSTLRASAARSSREISDAISGNLSPEKAAYIKPPKNDGNLEQRLGHFESDQQARKGWSENSSPRQLSASHDVSYADFKTKHSVSSKNAIDLNGNFDVKNSMGHEITISGADFGGVSSSAAEIVTSGISKPSLGIDLPITSKLVSEVTYLECLNQKTNSEQIADCEKYQSHKRVVESEGPFPPSLRDCSKIATTTITPPIVHSEEGTVAAVRGNTSYGLPELADGNDRPMTDLRAVPCQQSTQVETIKAATLPEHDFLWQGGFEVRSKGNAITYFDGIQAHASTCAASKVHDAAKKFASRLQLEEVPRCSSWPLQFQYCCPSDENIALYFFAKDHESYERPYRKLLEHMLKNDFALRGNFNGVELLIFPSNQLPENSQRWNRLLFLWGVFRQRKSSCMESPATRENVHGQPSKRYPFSASNLTGNDSPGVKLSPSMAGFPALEDMDIDTGGQEACVLERILKGPGRANASCHIQSPPAASEEEGPAGDCSNIQILYSVENEKVHSSENVDKKATERLAFIKKPSMRSAAESYQRSNSKNPYTKRVNETDLQLGLETSATHKQPNTRENSVCQVLFPLTQNTHTHRGTLGLL